jgi:hypothetical protein
MFSAIYVSDGLIGTKSSYAGFSITPILLAGKGKNLGSMREDIIVPDQ